jgi:tetratricopeptide (TPR) repeat protein
MTMSTVKLAVTLPATILLLASLAACGESGNGSSADAKPDETTSAKSAAVPAARTADPTDSAETNPMSERERERLEAWNEAVAGLSFETGRVVVEQPPAEDDVALAEAKIAEGLEIMPTNHRTETVAAFAAAVRAAPGMVEPYMLLGRAMTGKGRTEMAIACYRTVLDKDPVQIEAHYELALALSRIMRQDEAIMQMNALLELDPNYGKAHERLAIWHYQAGDYDRAWEHVHAARAIDHELPPQFIELLVQQSPDPDAG